MKNRLPILLTLSLLAHVSFAGADAPAIGALADLTGSFARLGEDCRGGYEVAVRTSGGNSKVIFGDNQNDPKVGISEFRRMRETAQVTSVVTTRSPVGLALNSLSAKEQIPLIGIVGHPRFTTENPFAIRVFPSARDEALTLAQDVDRTGSTVATISLEDEYFLGLRDAFVQNLRKSSIILSETISPQDSDFGTLLAKLKTKPPQVIFLNAGPSQIPVFVHKIRELQIPAKLYSNFLIGSRDVISSLGDDGQGIRFAELDYQQPEFVRTFEALNGKAPLSPLSYACYVALTYAFELKEDERTAGGLAKSKQIQTLDGAISFVNREGRFPVALKLLKGGEVIKADTPPREIQSTERAASPSASAK